MPHTVFHPTYLAIGLWFAWVGRRLERSQHQGPAVTDPGTIGPVTDPRSYPTIEA